MRWRLLWAIPLVIGLATACGDDVKVEDLVGTWNATQFVFSDFGDPVTDYDVIASGGAVTLTIQANNTYAISFTLPGSAPEMDDGTWALSGSTLTLDAGTVDETVLSISLSGNTLTFHSTDITFDFGDGDVPAKLDATLTRQ